VIEPSLRLLAIPMANVTPLCVQPPKNGLFMLRTWSLARPVQREFSPGLGPFLVGAVLKNSRFFLRSDPGAPAAPVGRAHEAAMGGFRTQGD
jgi:hypothetical protein